VGIVGMGVGDRGISIGSKILLLVAGGFRLAVFGVMLGLVKECISVSLFVSIVGNVSSVGVPLGALWPVSHSGFLVNGGLGFRVSLLLQLLHPCVHFYHHC
jgi:hypothetical protein